MIQNIENDPFSDIRPYNDAEVRPVLDRLLADPGFISSIAQFNAPRTHKWLPWAVNWLTRKKLCAQLSQVRDVASMQSVIAGYMDRMIERTSTGLTHSGLDKLARDRSYLFISNHRDIAMDPAFVNYMLYHAGFETLFIAIGDNLLKRPFVTDLMRLNKSFIVKRSLKGRDLLKSSKQLSEYIHHCIDGGRNVWIAQREGRAKDGIDRTETALLKMLGLARRDAGLGAALQQLHIVPVAISYEFDPCDRLKAEEILQRTTTGRYEKSEQSDIHSIVTGMVGFKGRVHVAFGEEIQPLSDADEDIAALIDAQIIGNYRLQPTNLVACRHLQGEGDAGLQVIDAEGQHLVNSIADNSPVWNQFNARLAAMPVEIRPIVLRMYANPVISRFGIDSTD
jgi:1-acyl-sn-glycerol-3-phosphate acyltransferase